MYVVIGDVTGNVAEVGPAKVEIGDAKGVVKVDCVVNGVVNGVVTTNDVAVGLCKVA
jgi:hypothetical protein